jgi:hypothetical protein
LEGKKRAELGMHRIYAINREHDRRKVHRCAGTAPVLTLRLPPFPQTSTTARFDAGAWSAKNEAVAGSPSVVAGNFSMKTPMWTVRFIGYVTLFFIAAVLVAVLTPAVDAINMAISWLITSAVLCGLFELGWLLYRRSKE